VTQAGRCYHGDERMTGTDHTRDVRDCGRDVAAYALGALEPAELEAFRAHLETCAACRDELAAFERVVDVLPMTVPQHRAPHHLRRRVRDAVKQEPRFTLGAQRRRRVARFSVRRPALALTAAVAILAVAALAVELGTSQSSTTRVYAAQVTGRGSAEVTVTGSHAELIVRHFSPPPAGHIYEVWLARPGHAPMPTSALFTVTASGERRVDVPGNLHGINVLMVTPEPPGGSRVPTHAPVIRAQLS
jgi:anti-sigma-K factor RskA